MTTVGIPANEYSEPRRSDVTVLPAVLRRTAWGAVFAGATTAIGLQFVLTVLGIAIGISSTDAYESNTRIGTGAAVWWLITGTISLLAGGIVLGRTVGIQRSIDVLLHAFAMWAVTAIFGFLVIWATAGMATSTAGNLIGSTWNPTQRMSAIDRTAGQRATGQYQATEGDRGAVTGDRSATNRDGDRTLTTAEIEEARRAARTASWWTLIGLLMGIAASLAGSWLGTSDRLLVRASNVPRP